MEDKLKSERRKIMAAAVRGAKKALGIDVDELARVQLEFDEMYDKLMPQILETQEQAAEVNAKKHQKMLNARYSVAKKGGLRDEIAPILPRCWCSFLDDFTESSVCDHSVPVLDVDTAGHVDTDFTCIAADNKAKPFVLLRGGGDGVTNSVELVSRIGFNINDSKFTTKGKYCLTPTTLLSGYWLKENWSGCEGITSTGDFSITLKMTATQLGGTKLLGELETTVFDWSSSDGYTGTIDKTYNVSGSSTTGNFVLYPEVDPADGDVFVEIELSIFMSMTGYGRFLVDMKNSSAFYFWVERLELAKHTCLPIHCIIGGPGGDATCKPGGPDTIHCLIGGPDTDILCTIGGPDSGVVCKPGGPDLPLPICKAGPDVGCPAGPVVGCLAGPPLDVAFDPGIWEKAVATVDMNKIPPSMKRAVTKMLEQINTAQCGCRK